ncbi:MAG TPA: PEPxxWA-CTERM sorting domain-containing protein, partial [Phenylobacterium sp.]
GCPAMFGDRHVNPIRKLACAAALAGAAALAPAVACANTALQFLGVGSTFAAFDTDETVGWTFTANANLNVTKLGWFVLDPTLDSFHQIGVWNASGALLGSASVLPPGPGSSDGFRYVTTPFTPFRLDAGQSYFIGGRDLLNDGDSYITGLNFLQTDPAISFLGSARSAAGSGFAFPNIVVAGARGRFGPNFQFDVIPDRPAVPEPATWAMMILGFGAAGTVLRRRRQEPAAAA